MPTLLKRLLSGGVYVALIVVSLLYTQWAFPVLCALFAVLGILEYSNLTLTVGTSDRFVKWLDAIFSMLVMLPIALCHYGIGISVAVISFYVLLRLTVQLYLKSKTPIIDISRSFLGMVWVVVPLAMLSSVFVFNMNDHLRYLVLVMFIMIWLNDSGAFVCGSLFGRTKLFERISPKKTWEGFWGGLIITALFGYFTPLIFHSIHASQWEMMSFGLLLSVVATIGDLVESMFKRSLNVKDSGNIMPGHGGILDRIDSLLFVAPCAFWFILIL